MLPPKLSLAPLLHLGSDLHHCLMTSPAFFTPSPFSVTSITFNKILTHIIPFWCLLLQGHKLTISDFKMSEENL